MNSIKEIHAFRNDDGTWRIEALSESVKFRKNGHVETKETTEGKIEIARAEIQIVAYPISCKEPTLFKLEIKD